MKLREISVYITLLIFSFYTLPYQSLKEVHIGYWSTWKIKCGIAIYTEHIYNALIQKGYTVYVYDAFLSDEEFISKLIADKITLLNIEYDPGIMSDPHKFIATIRKIRKLGIKIVATMHSEPGYTQLFYDEIDHFIYHKFSLFFPFTEKVSFIRMAVPVFNSSSSQQELRNKYGFKQEDKIISTFGFMVAWKEHADLLKLLVPYITSNPFLKVQFLTAYNAFAIKECTEECQKIHEIIKEYRLEKQVIHITDFLSQTEISERLWISDIGFLWNKNHTTSSSGAAKEFITARLPLITTYSSHYHDVEKGVIKVPTNKTLFINFIVGMLNNKEKLASMYTTLTEQYTKLNYNTIILEHVTLLEKILNNNF